MLQKHRKCINNLESKILYENNIWKTEKYVQDTTETELRETVCGELGGLNSNDSDSSTVGDSVPQR
jgi:hypothetical protein